MRNYILPTLTLVCLILSGVVFFAAHNTILALLFAVLGVLIWATAKSPLGHVPPKGVRPDVRRVKGYREKHPGSTIEDGILETTRFKN